MTNDSWGRVKQDLRTTVGHNNYVAWIEPLEFAALDDGVLTFSVPSIFLGNWVSRYYGDRIIEGVTASGEGVRRLAFVVKTQANGNAPAAAGMATDRAGAAARPVVVTGPATTGTDLNPRFTFDSFVVGKPNEMAYSAARRVAGGGPVPFNPLFFYGGSGLGKTHLMHAIGTEMRERDPAISIILLTAEAFMYQFVQAIRDRQMIDFKQIFRSVDVLMIDDMQFIAGKDSTQEEFFHTFNALVDQGKQIILSADKSPAEITGLDRRIVSRLQSGLTADMHPTSYELRLGILQRKVAQNPGGMNGVVFGDGVLELTARRITANVRELEGALNRLIAFGQLVDRPLDLDMTRECLADMMRHNDRRASIDEIQRVVADYYNIRISDLIGPKRTRLFSRPRQIAMFLSKEFTDRSLPEIGRKFGKRDHTTILHGIRNIRKLSEGDSQMADDLEMLRRTLRDL